jgi:hypothetical protein
VLPADRPRGGARSSFRKQASNGWLVAGWLSRQAALWQPCGSLLLAGRNMSRIGPASDKPERLDGEQASASYK